MNYVPAVYGIMMIIIVTDWLVRGRKHYRGQQARHEEVHQLTAGGDVVIR